MHCRSQSPAPLGGERKKTTFWWLMFWQRCQNEPVGCDVSISQRTSGKFQRKARSTVATSPQQINCSGVPNEFTAGSVAVSTNKFANFYLLGLSWISPFFLHLSWTSCSSLVNQKSLLWTDGGFFVCECPWSFKGLGGMRAQHCSDAIQQHHLQANLLHSMNRKKDFAGNFIVMMMNWFLFFKCLVLEHLVLHLVVSLEL